MIPAKDRSGNRATGQAHTAPHGPTRTYTDLHGPTRTYTDLHGPTRTYTADLRRAMRSSIATLLKPPSGMITSAYLLVGSTNCRCMGRTTLRY